MDELQEMLKQKNDERDAIISELNSRTAYANGVVNEIYSKRQEKMKRLNSVISSLLEDGNIEALLGKMAEVESFAAQSPDNEIRERLQEYNLRNCK